MYRTELLITTRDKYLEGFLRSIDLAVSKCADGLFKKADVSYSSAEQGRYLDALGFFRVHETSLRSHTRTSMEQLLNRSLQTTYSAFRPSFASNFKSGNLALVELEVLENELHIVEITNRFRNEAEEQVRDLNIRIALLFEQDEIKERENPFRPYLLSSSIAMAFKTIGVAEDLARVLIDELAEHMEPQVAKIYDSVNMHLSNHGIAAELQVRIKKSRSMSGNVAAGSDDKEVKSSLTDDTSDLPVERERAIGGIADTAPSLPSDTGLRASPRASAAPNLPPDARSEASARVGAAPTADDFDIDKVSSGASIRTVDQFIELVRRVAASAGGAMLNGAARPAAPGSGDWDRSPAQAQAPGRLRKQFDGPFAGISQRDVANASKARADSHFDTSHTTGSHGVLGLDWLTGKQSVGKVLRNFFSGQRASAETNSPPSDAGAPRQTTTRLTDSIDQFLRERTPANAVTSAGESAIANLILEQRSSLYSLSEQPDEKITIDIVAMLFEFILRDTQIPAEVRAQLGRLQFLVLKVALLDASLLTRKGHPARLLVNRIGSISLGFKQIDPSGDRITVEIRRIVETLLSAESESANLFSKMLDEFDAFIAKELRGSNENVERAVQAVENAQSRTLRFAHITAQMNESLSGLTIDPFLHEFLVADWVQAIERAERTESARATRFRALVPDLLWSIVPKALKEDKAQLFASLPGILRTLREGFEITDCAPARQQTILGWLMDAHTKALRSGHGNVSRPSLSSIQTRFNKFLEAAQGERPPNTASNPEQYKQFFDEAIKQLDAKIQVLDTFFDSEPGLQLDDRVDEAAPVNTTVDASIDEPVEAQVGAQVEKSSESVTERLRSGIPIRINLGGVPGLGRLNWIDPSAANMVLTLDQQATPSTISVRMFRRLYKNGRVSFLESAPLFERAVESLLKLGESMEFN